MPPLREFLPGLSTWSWFSENHGYDFNGTLVQDPTGNLVIDPVVCDDAVLARLVEVGVDRVLITNRNHARDADAVHRATGAPVWIHPCDADYAREQGVGIDATFEFGELGVPLSAVHDA